MELTRQEITVEQEPGVVNVMQISRQHTGILSRKLALNAELAIVTSCITHLMLQLRELQCVQLPRPPIGVAAGELPAPAVPAARDVDETPLDWRRDGRPVRPQAALGAAVEVHEEEGDDVRGAGLCDGALAPGLEDEAGVCSGGRALLRRAGVVGEGGEGADFGVEVGFEVCLEGGHDAAELGGGEVEGVLEGG